MPFQKGNKAAAKENRIWGDELRKVIAQDKRVRVRAAIEKQLDAAAAGDLAASKEIADRLDGKPKQAMEVAGRGGGPIVTRIELVPLDGDRSDKAAA